MITLSHAEVIWQLNNYCQLQCSYCPASFKNGSLDRSTNQYLTVIEKLQATRYQHHNKIHWRLGGGEPLHYPHLSTLLKKIKSRPAHVTLETSGDDTWFAIMSILNYIDRLLLTYHPWQNSDVFDFIFEQAAEKNIKISITVPLAPGLILESKQKVLEFRNLGYDCQEQILRDGDGQLHSDYSQVDVNRIQGRADNWEPAPVVIDKTQPDPNYVSLAVTNPVDPIYTGKPCYAGVDWIEINARGFVSNSQCGGRTESLNAFDPDWQPPNNYFACTVNQCRSSQDRAKIRIVGS